MIPMVRKQNGEMIPFKDFPQEIHPERLWVLAHLGETEGKLVADVGCGGHKTVPWAAGVDVMPGADYQCSLDELPFNPESVDVIISRHSLEHVLDPVNALYEWHRVLKQNGKVIIVLPDHNSVDTLQPILSAGCHLHAYDMDSFRSLIFFTPFFCVEKLEIVLEDWSFGAVLRPA